MKKNNAFSKKTYFLLIVGLALLYFVFKENNDTNEGIKNEPVPYVGSKTQNANEHRLSQNEIECQNQYKPLVSDKPIRSMKELKPQIKNSIKYFRSNQSNFMSDLEIGEEITSIAAFSIVRACQVVGENLPDLYSFDGLSEQEQVQICEQVPDVWRKNPLNLFKTTLLQKSPEARFLYASNFDFFIKISKFNGKLFSSDEENIIRKQAEEYGTAAAQDGIQEAYWFMARAYVSGTFGTPDLMKAYAFTLPLSKNEEHIDASERLNFLYPNMTRIDLDQAQMLAFGCNQKNMKYDSLLNPFKKDEASF